MHLLNPALHNFMQVAYLVIAFVQPGDVKAISTSDNPSCIFDEIPQAIPMECTTLTIQNGNLGALSSSTFSHLNASNIETLIISDNGITQIRRNALESFPALQYLEASDNEITILESGAFHYLQELKHLYLQGNRIRTISNSAFEGLETLTFLRLDNNQLTNIGSFFSDVPNLETLNLTSNEISEISSNAFDELIKLQDLFLAYNRLTGMPEALKDERLKKLHVLNLRSNLINTTLTSSHLHYDYLEKLYLTNNDIPALSDNAFKYLRRLEVLHLDYNRLTNLDAWLDNHPQKLQEIKLDNNQWDCKCNNTHVWELLGNHQNLTIVEHDSTFCATPFSRRREVVFDFVATCESEPLLSLAALIGIIAASAVIFTGCLITICICCCRKIRQRSRTMSVSTAKSHHSSIATTDSQAELPNHEYLSHVSSPTDKNSNGKPAAGDSSTLRSHIYDLPNLQEAIRRDPSYINGKVLRMNLKRSGIDLKPIPIPRANENDSDTDADYYLVPVDKITANRSRNDSDDGIFI